MFCPSDRSPLATTTADEDETITTAVCRLVASVADEQVLDLPPLGESVDPDVLESVVSPRQHSGHVAFGYLDYLVVVHADRTIAVYEGD